MAINKKKRTRGVVLTDQGLQKFREARLKLETEDNFGNEYTLEKIAERSELCIDTISKILARKEGADKESINELFENFGLELNKSDYLPPNIRVDWGEATHPSVFYGRTEEIATLEQWIIGERCRLVALLGMRGVGKTALSVKLTEHIQRNFKYVMWHSLKDAPPVDAVLANLIQFLSDEQETGLKLPESLKERISVLKNYLCSLSCLVVLDDAESIISGGERAGQYRSGYEGYGKLIKMVGEVNHISCIVLASQEEPEEVVLLKGEKVHSLRLNGLKVVDGQKILEDKKVFGTQDEYVAIVDRYTGNPLALNLVAETIKDIYDGKIAEFLKEDTFIFGEIHDVFDQQFERLPDLEKKIMYWLAINREPIALLELEEDTLLQIPKAQLLKAVQSLVKRSLIENSESLVTLQSAVMEYVTNKFVELVCEEIRNSNIHLFKFHALMKAQAKDYIRETQVRLILKPVINGLLASFENNTSIENRFKEILATLRETSSLEKGYTSGNILNIFDYLEVDLTSYDFSNASVRQADLRGVNLHYVNFQNANLAKCVFTETLGAIHSIAFSPNGKLLVTGDTYGEVRLYEVETGKQLLACNEHTSWVWSVAFSPDGQVFASGSEDKTVKLWDTSTGQCLTTFCGHNATIWSVAFHPTGTILATGSEDQTIKLWDISAEQCLETLEGHSNRVTSVAFSPDGQTLASGSDDHTVRVWNVGADSNLLTQINHNSGIWSVVFSPDGQTLAGACRDKTVSLWNISNASLQMTLKGHKDWVTSVAFSIDGNTIVSGSHDQTIKLWHVNTGDCFKTILGHDSRIWSVTFNPQSTMLASSSSDQTVKLWHISDGRCFKTLYGYCNGIWSVSINPQGTMLASGSGDKTVKLWDVDSSKCPKTLRSHNGRVTSVVFSPQGTTLASSSEDKTIKLWDVAARKCLKTLQGHCSRVTSVAFSPNGTILASGSEDKTVRLWDLGSGQCLKTLDEHTLAVWSVAFSPDGNILASGSWDRTIKLWDINTGKFLKTLEGHSDWVWSVTFSMDGRLLASTSSDQTIKIWDVSTGELLYTLQEHRDCVYSAAFSPDGYTLASGSGDKTVKLWDLSTSKCVRTLSAHSKLVWSVAYSSNGQILVSGSQDDIINFWDVKTGECTKSLRNPRPYEGMNITGIKGVTEATKASLIDLGAVSDE